VTATRKIQRDKFYRKFKDLIESMYAAEEEERISAELGLLEDEVVESGQKAKIV